ncbi:hypothetical protein EDD21DRAFT_421430 [Dissophora ornata]|nr:hypothetical protein EDD21DRAFT_421430 [Dissophora ornata]
MQRSWRQDRSRDWSEQQVDDQPSEFDTPAAAAAAAAAAESGFSSGWATPTFHNALNAPPTPTTPDRTGQFSRSRMSDLPPFSRRQRVETGGHSRGGKPGHARMSPYLRGAHEMTNSQQHSYAAAPFNHLQAQQQQQQARAPLIRPEVHSSGYSLQVHGQHVQVGSSQQQRHHQYHETDPQMIPSPMTSPLQSPRFVATDTPDLLPPHLAPFTRMQTPDVPSSHSRMSSFSEQAISTTTTTPTSEPETATPQPILAQEFSKYDHLPLGSIPPKEVCLAVGQRHLAKVPLKDIGFVSHYISTHRHFFNEATREEKLKHKLPVEQKYVFCRVVDNNITTPCDKPIKTSNSGQLRYNHMASKHPLILHELLELRGRQGDVNIEAARSCFTVRSTRQGQSNVGKKRVENRMSQQAACVIARRIAVSQLPFTVLDSLLLQEVLKVFGVEISLPTDEAVKNAMSIVHSTTMTKVKKVFQDNIALGSFTTHDWTSSSDHRKYLGLTFHFLKPDFTLCSVAIGMQDLKSLDAATLSSAISTCAHT